MCPVCKEEWTSLRPSQFFDVDGKNVVTHVCVTCAETFISFLDIVELTALAGVHVQVKWSKPRYTKVRIGDRIVEHDSPKGAYAIISYGDASYIATSGGTGTAIKFKREGEADMRYANNTFALCSMIRHELQNQPERRERQHWATQ
jgi:hypothetical protein